MKMGFVIFMLGLFAQDLTAQKNCSAFNYSQNEMNKDASLASKVQAIENFILSSQSSRTNSLKPAGTVIKIPVVVHILYHYSSEKISDEQVNSQIAALNRAFRRTNADSVNTPAVFKPFAADCEIEFQLARSDSRRRSTSGIIRKYTPMTSWTGDDKMKFSAETGDDAWDSKSYLNIWVCNLDRFAGYASFPGADAAKDGIVLDFDAFGGSATSGYGMGRTAVHEAGHWLGLKHLWGDANCGDDGVADTPKQAGYTPGCPNAIRITCSNGPYGDMYMNYMDFTNDACMNMFTKGQKARMRALFSNGGPRKEILDSKGLSAPLIFESPIPEEEPKWLDVQLYPNPSTTEINLDLSYDSRWMENTVRITNVQGQSVMNGTITSKIQKLDISSLKPGIYFLAAKRGDGLSILQKFIKL
jgi:hypothetical protein